MTPFDPYAYLDAVSAALDLPIPPERRDAVAANLVRLHTMAQEVMAFPLPSGLPPGPSLNPQLGSQIGPQIGPQRGSPRGLDRDE